MKKTLRRSKLSGFTLVELLVVIAIIAILAGVILSSGSMALKAAQRAKAGTMASQLQTASMAYFTEYSVYPIPASAAAGKDYEIHDTTAGTDTTGTADDTAWGNLTSSLCGMINPSTGVAVAASTAIPANTRSIAFLSLKSSDVDAKGTPLNALASGTSIYFNIAMDGDYDNLLGVAPSVVLDMPNFSTGTATSLTLTGGTSSAGVAVWGNCTTKTAATACNAGFWVHTY
jgi:prepilin-type N-terminal cleavage/methylation domain-containing protein